MNKSDPTIKLQFCLLKKPEFKSQMYSHQRHENFEEWVWYHIISFRKGDYLWSEALAA